MISRISRVINDLIGIKGPASPANLETADFQTLGGILLQSLFSKISFNVTRSPLPSEMESALRTLFTLNRAYVDFEERPGTLGVPEIERLRRDCWEAMKIAFPSAKNRPYTYSYNNLVAFVGNDLPRELARYGILCHSSDYRLRSLADAPLALISECRDIDQTGANEIRLFGGNYRVPTARLSQLTEAGGIESINIAGAGRISGMSRFGTAFLLKGEVRSERIEMDPLIVEIASSDLFKRFEQAKNTPEPLNIAFILTAVRLLKKADSPETNEEEEKRIIDHESCHVAQTERRSELLNRDIPQVRDSLEFLKMTGVLAIRYEIGAYLGELHLGCPPRQFAQMIILANDFGPSSRKNPGAHLALRWIVNEMIEDVRRRPQAYSIEIPEYVSSEDDNRIIIALQLDKVLERGEVDKQLIDRLDTKYRVLLSSPLAENFSKEIAPTTDAGKPQAPISRKQADLEEVLARLRRDGNRLVTDEDFSLARYAYYGSPPHRLYQSVIPALKSAGHHLLRKGYGRVDKGQAPVPEWWLAGIHVFERLVSAAGWTVALPVMEVVDHITKSRADLLYLELAGKIALCPGSKQAREKKFRQICSMLERKIEAEKNKPR